jgi:hypothetical protein
MSEIVVARKGMAKVGNAYMCPNEVCRKACSAAIQHEHESMSLAEMGHKNTRRPEWKHTCTCCGCVWYED